MLSAFLAAAPALANIVGGLFGKNTEEGETVTMEQLMPDWQKATGEQLSQWVQQYLKNYAPGQAYNGKFTAGATGIETQGLDQLQNLMNTPATGDLFSAGKQQVLDTLGGRYANPNESPWIKSMINLSKQNLSDQITSSRRQAGARGNYYSKSAISDESDLNERTLNNLNAVIGDFMNTERGRQFSAVPIAQSMDQYSTLTAPLAKIQASQSLGNLMRTIEQSDLESQYQDYLNQRKELSALPNTAQNMYSTSSQYGVPSWQMTDVQQTNTFGNIMDVITKLNTSALGEKGNIWDKLSKMIQGPQAK